MSGLWKLSRRARWAVPVGALVIPGGVLAGSLVSVAQAAPSLPSRTPAQLLAAVAQGQDPALSGIVVETAALGLPSLPATGSATSISSLLTGSHTIQVWYAGPKHYRLALPASLTETDVIRDGGTAYLWQSSTDSVTEVSIPARAAKPVPASTPALNSQTPQQAAQQVLAAVGPTTTVSVDSNVTVAGQPAYELVLAPKSASSLVGQVRIAVDGHNEVPLRVQVFARGASSPAISVGYTSVSFATPAPADTSFTPPSGAKITKVNLGQHAPAQSQAQAGVSSIGSGWLTVLELPSAALTAGSLGGSPAQGPVSANNASGESAAVLSALLASAKSEHGAWGTGRLLRTSLVSVLITDNGSAFIGAVRPSVLYAAATQAAHHPAATP
jgi:hypothetical protein